jgi:putative Mg2+ transporter-C (MgtC) family protein
MDLLWQELSAGLPDAAQAVRIALRLLAAALAGAVIGIERESSGKPAGVRTHMLVAAGAALFVLASAEAGLDADGLSRVIQGVATGLGFIGGGAILKLTGQREIEGLTTAAGIWMTAAIGVAAGLGRLGLALLSAGLTWLILDLLGRLERRLNAPEA